MGWRNALRSYNASMKSLEREAIKEQNRLIKQAKALEKKINLEEAELEVNIYNNLIYRLTALHKDCTQVYDWKSIINFPEPLPPCKKNEFEHASIQNLSNYHPNIFEKIFRLEIKIKARLMEKIEEAKKIDEQAYDLALKNYHREFEEWKELQDLSESILRGESPAYDIAIAEFSPFNEMEDLGSKISIKYINKESAEIDFFANGIEVIPWQSKVLLKNGKVSLNKISPTKHHELYQDYVASATFRIAREIFAILPLEKITITVLADLLDRKTGNHKNMPILSALITRSIIHKLNFEALDPSTALDNFLYNSNFKKGKGFSETDRLVMV